MCGICGYYHYGDPSVLATMLRPLRHRGPDDEGTYTDDEVGLGIRRLSVIDIEGGRQPLSNEDGSIQVVYNGEIYNFKALRTALEQKGHRFATRCDTEVIAHLYEEYGDRFPETLRGMFAIALWDRKKRQLHLVRDRFGIKPLYVADHGGGLLFASELGALRAAVPALSINHAAIARYCMFGYIPRPDTIYETVRQVEPGTIMTLGGTACSARAYFRMDAIVSSASVTSDTAELIERFRALFKETVAAHLVSDVPLGLLLSSGLDSGSILAMMHAAGAGSIKTFSIGYRNSADAGFNETDVSRAVSHRFGAQHTEELLAPDIGDLLSRVVDAMGEPFADASAIPTFLVSRLARQSVTVALSGIGGDELFGGYPRYLGLRAGALYRRLPLSLRRLAAGAIAPLFPEAGTHRDQLGRLKRFLRSGTQPLDCQYLEWVTFLPGEWQQGFFSDGALEAAAQEPIERYRSLFNAWPRQTPEERAMGMDLQTYLIDDLLRMADRLSMYHSLEIRVPFCDHELLAFALGVSATTRIRGWRLKAFMREALAGVLPRDVLRLPKRGFMVPIARWLRQDLNDMVSDLLSESAVKARGYLNPAFVLWLRKEHDSGRRNFSDQIYALCVLELWMRKQENRARK